MIPPAEVVHHIPGRLRFRVEAARRNPQLLENAAQFIAAMRAVNSAESRIPAASIVVFYQYERQETFLAELTELGRAEGLFELQPAITVSLTRSRRVTAVQVRRAARVQRKLESPQGLALRKIAGRSLLALGVAGVLLPIIPGTPLLLAGAAVLGSEDPVVARASRWIGNVRSMFGKG